MKKTLNSKEYRVKNLRFDREIVFPLLVVVICLSFTARSHGQAVVFVAPAEVASPASGQELTVNINIAGGVEVAGYQVTVHFDPTALSYVSSANADYLPAGTFSLLPEVREDSITIGAASLTGGAEATNGTLATVTFRVVEAKASSITLTDVVLSDDAANALLEVTSMDGAVVAAVEALAEEPAVAEDGAVVAAVEALAEEPAVAEETPVVVEPEIVVSIPDPNLTTAIRDALGLPFGAPITTHAMLKLTRLDASGRGIADLTGLEYAINLTKLRLGQAWGDGESFTNPISDLSALAALTQLTHLELDGTAVSDVAPLAHLTQLKTLQLDNTAVSDVAPLENLTQLTELKLRNCPLNAAAHQTHIPAIQANGTEVLFDPLPPEEVIDFPDANLAAAIRGALGLPAGAPITTHSILGLVTLDAPNAGIKDLTGLAYATNLTTLLLGSESVNGTEVNSNTLAELAPIAQLKALTTLDLSGTAVSSTYSLGSLTQLTSLNLSDTAVSDISYLPNLTQLTFLNLGETGIVDVSVLVNLTGLLLLNLQGAPLNLAAHQTHIPAMQVNGVTVLFDPLPPEEVVDFPDVNLAAAIRDALGLPAGAPITSHAMLNLTMLDAPGRGITDLTGLEYAINLTWLHLGYVDAVVDGEPFTNPISDLSALAALTQLTELYLDYTAVSDVVPLANLTQLTYLRLSSTAVSDVAPLANLTQLTWLDLYSTAVSDVAPLANLTQLTWLNLEDTAVSDVTPLTTLTQLTRLYLRYTAVSDVTPLANLTQLTELDLRYTAVSDVAPLANLTQLTWLSLRYTAVSDVAPLVNLTQLTELNLYDCPLNAAAHQTHIPAIQANGTEVSFAPFKPIHLPRVPWLVSLIYFRPSDRPVRPNVDAKIDALIKKAQRFFADQLELHGFERKTFQFETDAHGNAVVHHVAGKFPRAHYPQNRYSWVDEINEQIHVPPRSFTVHMLDSAGGRSFTGALGTGGGGNHGGRVNLDLWHWHTLAHELGHAFGLQHDRRRNANTKRITSIYDRMITSFCAAEWLSVHPAFNPGQAVSTKSTTIEMLPPILVSPPNTIRLRFEVTDPDGLHQAQLRVREFGNLRGGLLDCKGLSGVRGTVEFVTTDKLPPEIESVSLAVIDVRGNMSRASFPIDVTSLLPPAKPVSIPDPNLAAAIREELGLTPSKAITTHTMLGLDRLEAPNAGIKDLTGLEHAVHLRRLNLDYRYISGEGNVNSSAVTDFSPLEKLTNLQTLLLSYMSNLVDVSALANLTQLEVLELSNTAVSDVSALANLTQLEVLELSNTAVSDVSALANLTQLEVLELNGTAVDVSTLANLTQLRALGLSNTAVSDVSALVSTLANLTQLVRLGLSNTAVSDVSALANLTQLRSLELAFTAVDVSTLANLTQLRALGLYNTAVSDVSALANLTQLRSLDLSLTAVSDVSALANLTQLVRLYLRGTAVSDVSALANLTQLEQLRLGDCPLSYASLHTHIPALVKGIKVEYVSYDNVAHPALLKTSGDEQEGAGGTALPNPFVVEAMDEHGKPIGGKPVQFEILAGGGTLSAQTATTDARGKAQITLTLGRAAGVNKVKATAEGIESWVLFTTLAPEAAPQLAADVNGDGIVNILDLTAVSGKFGETGEIPADVNGDGQVNIQDLVMVAGAFGQEAAAPSARAVSLARLTAADLEQWLSEARSASRPGGLSYRRGIVVLEQLLANLIPEETALLANYPNPFNPETWIPYQLATPAEVTVTIYAATGAVVRTLALGHRPAGNYDSRSRAAYWDGRNALGERVASGVYFYTLQAGDFAATRKMLILK